MNGDRPGNEVALGRLLNLIRSFSYKDGSAPHFQLLEDKEMDTDISQDNIENFKKFI